MSVMITYLKKFLFSTFHLFIDYYYNYRSLCSRIETLEFIVRSQCPITKCAKATGDLRLLQLGSTALLKKCHTILHASGLNVWLDSGTLLGAVRHGGFIPWDDDIDVATTRNDYYNIFELLKSSLPQDLYSVTVSDCIRIIYKGTPCQIDIFPYDEVGFPKSQNQADISKFRNDLTAYNYATFEFDWHRLKTDSRVIVNKTNEEISKLVLEYTDKYKGAYTYYAQGVEVRPTTFCMLPKDKIFSLKTLPFEGEQFFVPSDVDAYLRQEYGDYMAYPPSIHLHSDIQERMNTDSILKIRQLMLEQGFGNC